MNADYLAAAPLHEPYWGKYRGTVIDNVDPLVSARLLCEVPAVPAALLNWAMPCVTYSGFEQGLVAVPPIGANVWIEFEGGNPDLPIWSGCFWQMGEIPLMPELSPEAPELVNVLRSKFCTLLFNDIPAEGGIFLNTIDPAVEVPVTLTMTTAGLEVNVGAMNLLINAESGITMTAGETVVTVTPEAVGVEAPAVTVAADLITLNGVTKINGETTVTGAFNVNGLSTLAPEVIVNGGPLTVDGAAAVTGAVDITGGIDVGGAGDFAGALATEGEFEVAGTLTAQGDVAVLGAVEVAGTVVAPTFEGVVVPPPFP